MKSIIIKEWNEKIEENGIVEEKIIDTLKILTVLVNAKNPKDMPKGLDYFRIFHRLAISFEEAQKTKVLKLEDVDYDFLKNLIQEDIPSDWGRNPDIYGVIDDFLNAK